MNIKKLSDKAKIPTKGSDGAAGYDLYTVETHELKPGEIKSFKTDLSIAIPEGYYGRIAPRSGLAAKYGINVLAGVIDSDYTGEILVLLINHGNEPITLPLIKDDKETAVAQIIFEQCNSTTFSEVDELTVTQRGDGGFGSSDVKRETKDLASTQMKNMQELYENLDSAPSSPKKTYSELIREREQTL